MIYLTISLLLLCFTDYCYSRWALFWLLSMPRLTLVIVVPILPGLLFAVVVLGRTALLITYYSL